MSIKRYRTALPLCLTSLAWFSSVWANMPPEADFDVRELNGLDLSLLNQSDDPDGDKLTFKWYFGDGTTSRALNPVHTYNAYGIYTVTLKVSDGTATVKTAKKVTVEKVNRPPVASFTAVSNAALKIRFSNLSSDPDGDSLTYKWYFGDGTSSREKDPEHTYQTAGTYQVALKVSDGSKTVKYVQNVAVIDNRSPVASFEISENSDRRVSLRNTSYDPDGDSLKCKWDFGDGLTSKDCNASHEYATDGTYRIILKVSDGSKTAKTAKNVSVEKSNQSPVASFDVIENAGLKIRLLNLSSDPDGDALTCKWYFGDGSISKEKDPEHTYAQPGVYQVTLKASDGNQTVKSVQNVSVTANQPPVADFEVAEKSGRKVTLVNNSSDPDGDALKYKWYFGDGSASKERNPVHTYAGDGTYSVVLKVSDGQVTKSKTLNINVGVQNDDFGTYDWAELEGTQDLSLVELTGDLPEMSDACKVSAGQIIVSGEIADFDKYGAWFWGAYGNLYSQWPGRDITDNVIEACNIKTRFISIPDVEFQNLENPALDDGWSAVINDFGGGHQTVDIDGLSQKKNCIKLSEEKDARGRYLGSAVSPRECGVHVGGMPELDEVPVDVYLSFNGKKYFDGDSFDYTEFSGNDDSKSVEAVLLLRGVSIDENTAGQYWFNDDEYNKVEFKNGARVKIGENIGLAEEGDWKEGILHISYTPKDAEGHDRDTVTASITITKNYVEKDDAARMRGKEPDETLGAIYTNEKTTFRIWSPDSADVRVSVDGTDYEMKPVQLDGYANIYEAAVEGDLAGKTYQFSVNGNKVRDPYGRMTARGSDTANIVMDLDSTDPEDGWTDRPELRNREDAVVYEVHVRDFTIDPTSGVDDDKRGRYLGMVQEGTSYNGFATGIDHLKKLGITHVQLMPIFDYAACSDVDSQDSSCYSWGHDPLNYNVPEDRYTSVFGTDQYEEKIREVKTMINEFHKNGIRVVMDVVYNHTFDKSVLGKITDRYYLGSNDLSGCGNAVNADNNMVWMMIRDSLDYWVTEYHVDGFRLDLAGVFGIRDFSDWGRYLNRRHPDANLLIYGQPWTGGGDASAIKDPVRTGRMFMQDPDAHVGVFNNRIRNCLKSTCTRSDSSGSTSRLGFIFNQLNTDWDSNGTDENGKRLEGNRECVFMSIKAGVRTENAPAEVKDEWSAQGFSDPEQAISFITAHEDLALRDKIERASIDGLVLYNEDEVKTIQAYANSIIMISQGIAFIHGGEELGRTKKAAGESGESPMWDTNKTITGANDFRWDLLADGWAEVNETYGAYIRMRRAHPAFRMTTAEFINENVTLDPASTDEVVVININGWAVNDEWGTIKVVMNSRDTEVEVAGVDGMIKVADGRAVDLDNSGDVVAGNNLAAARAVSIWVTGR